MQTQKEVIDLKELMTINAGKRIADECKKRGITQKYIAEYIGVSDSHMSSFVCGKRTLHLEKILMLSDYFNISIDEIFNIDEIEDDDIIKVELLSLKQVEFLNDLIKSMKKYEVNPSKE